jgi:hypothetical protein
MTQDTDNEPKIHIPLLAVARVVAPEAPERFRSQARRAAVLFERDPDGNLLLGPKDLVALSALAAYYATGEARRRKVRSLWALIVGALEEGQRRGQEVYLMHFDDGTVRIGYGLEADLPALRSLVAVGGFTILSLSRAERDAREAIRRVHLGAASAKKLLEEFSICEFAETN